MRTQRVRFRPGSFFINSLLLVLCMGTGGHLFPVGVPDVRLGDSAPSLHIDPCHSLRSLNPPQVALPSLPIPNTEVKLMYADTPRALPRVARGAILGGLCCGARKNHRAYADPRFFRPLPLAPLPFSAAGSGRLAPPGR